MLGTYMSLKQTLLSFNKVLDKVEQAGSGDIDISRNEAMLYSTKGSMIKLLSTFIIEPTIVISRDLREEEVTEKLAEINLDIFASFYIQAFNVMTNVYGMSQHTAFDVLSSKGGLPIRANGGKSAFEEMDMISFEDNDFLPISLEQRGNRRRPVNKNANNKYQQAKNFMNKVNGRLNKLEKTPKENKEMKLVSPSARINEGKGVIVPTLMQKSIDITFTVNSEDKKSGKKFTRDIIVPVLIKATVIYSDFSNIETMVDTNGRDKKFSSRLDEYRAGMISLGDLIFADDLIKEYKNNKFKDKDDLIGYMESRATTANKKLLTKGAIGFGKYYSILIINKRQLAIIENKLGGKIDKPRYKEMLAEQTKSLLINVVDTDWERVTVYTKDLRGTSDLSFKVIKKRKGDGNSNELAEVFKAISSNKPPVF